jgi:hypothetical protein
MPGEMGDTYWRVSAMSNLDTFRLFSEVLFQVGRRESNPLLR